jgi:CubicO group peptidase (beta-lactamase class C family)
MGSDFESLLRARLFEPLGMNAYIAAPPTGIAPTPGHGSNGMPTKPWNMPVDLAGHGGVRATLDDMIRYAQALLGDAGEPVRGILTRTTERIAQTADGPEMAMAWIRVDVASRAVWFHDGGTGGFSSLIGFDAERTRAVVLLSDTSWINVGGLTELALHLFEPGAEPLAKPRTLATPSPALVQSLVGRYVLAGAAVELSEHEGSLVSKSEAGPELHFAYDSYGDFFAREADVLLRPVELDPGLITFEWARLGNRVRAERKP